MMAVAHPMLVFDQAAKGDRRVDFRRGGGDRRTMKRCKVPGREHCSRPG